MGVGDSSELCFYGSGDLSLAFSGRNHDANRQSGICGFAPDGE